MHKVIKMVLANDHCPPFTENSVKSKVKPFSLLSKLIAFFDCTFWCFYKPTIDQSQNSCSSQKPSKYK